MYSTVSESLFILSIALCIVSQSTVTPIITHNAVSKYSVIPNVIHSTISESTIIPNITYCAVSESICTSLSALRDLIRCRLFCLGFGFLAHTHFKLFNFQIFLLWACLMTVFPETRRAHKIWYLRFYFSWYSALRCLNLLLLLISLDTPCPNRLLLLRSYIVQCYYQYNVLYNVRIYWHS